jgi:hypothetical protein
MGIIPPETLGRSLMKLIVGPGVNEPEPESPIPFSQTFEEFNRNVRKKEAKK